MEQYFKSLANKRNSQEPPFLRFLQYDPKQVRVLTDLFFLVLDQQIKNPLMQHATIYFCIFVQPLWISYYFEMLKSFLSSNNTPARAYPCNISWLEMHFK